jgi:hypothetical protein
LKSLGDRLDFTYNIVSFILWVKYVKSILSHLHPIHFIHKSNITHRIENYSILFASCAPVARLFLRTIVDARHGGRPGYWSKSNSNNNYAANDTELKSQQSRSRTGWMDSATATATATTQWQDEEGQHASWEIRPERSLNRGSKGYGYGNGSETEGMDDGAVTVKTDIVVQVDDGRSTSSGDARLLPGGGEMSVGREEYGYHAR